MTLTRAELKTLLAIEEPIPMTELANKLGISKGTLSTLLHSIERRASSSLRGRNR